MRKQNVKIVYILGSQGDPSLLPFFEVCSYLVLRAMLERVLHYHNTKYFVHSLSKEILVKTFLVIFKGGLLLKFIKNM